ncbi:MAG: hypothetical protein M0R80_07935 [Proteobacteria bacterium]|jgi:hypothetical protein|nr:hypothetical protein [Pseudomonadota bacterium]
MDAVVLGITLDGKKVVSVIFRFDIWHCAWELDNLGWVVEFEDSTRGIVFTDHCKPYLGTAAELANKIAEYEMVIAETKKAIDISEGK